MARVDTVKQGNISFVFWETFVNYFTHLAELYSSLNLHAQATTGKFSLLQAA